MRRIGGALIEERRQELLAGGAVSTDGRDLLTVMRTCLPVSTWRRRLTPLQYSRA